MNKTFLGAAGGLAESLCQWRINRLSPKHVVDSFQLYFGHGPNKSSYFPDRFRNEKMKCICTFDLHITATFSEFASPWRSHRAHALSSVAKGSTRYELYPCRPTPTVTTENKSAVHRYSVLSKRSGVDLIRFRSCYLCGCYSF